MKVSVVVPVYNAGEKMEPLIQSLLAQSLPTDEFEVVFVDDGSTDDSPERLARLCAQAPNMRMTTIPNSGWPGRPRNVGTDLADGEYVFYADQDDNFFPRSLERMHAMASANRSDIVYGKVVRHGVTTPEWDLQKRTVEVADPVQERVAESRTTHKLYRRQFLMDHTIRFPEGRVRLEDFNFMGQAIPHAQVISILSDYPCYRWIDRLDGTNHSAGPLHQPTYWGYYREALHLFGVNAEDDKLRDQGRVIIVSQAFSRFLPHRYERLTPEAQQDLVDSVRAMLEAELPAELDAEFPVLKRLRLHAFRDGDKQRFEGIQELTAGLAYEVRVTGLDWRDGAFHVSAEADVHGPAELAVHEAPDGTSDLPGLRHLARPEAPEDRLLPTEHWLLELTVRQRGTGLEWPLPCTARLLAGARDEGVLLSARVDAVIEPEHGVFDQPLDDGVWDLVARVGYLEERKVVRPQAPVKGSHGRATTLGGRSISWYRNDSGGLTWRLQADEPVPSLRSRASLLVARVSPALHLRLRGLLRRLRSRAS